MCSVITDTDSSLSSVADPGKGPGGPALPLRLVQTEAQRAEKFLFCFVFFVLETTPPRYLRSGSGTEADKNGDLFPVPPKSPSCFTACAFWCGMLERLIRAST